VFTENYNVGSGGASYIVDLCNGAAGLYDDMVFASNPTGFAPDTSVRLVAPHTMREAVRICTADRIGVDVTASTWLPKRHRLAGELRRLAIKHESRVFAYNVGVCRRLIRKTRPSAVIAYNGGYPAARSVLAMAVAAKAERLPVALCVVSVPGARPDDSDLARWEVRMDAMVAASVDVIIVNAHSIANALADLRGLPADKMRVVHNALPDIPVLRQPAMPDRLRIGCVSRMDQMKGTRFLVEGFARVVGTTPSAELMLVGDGPERENVEALVAELGLSERVIMTGHYPGDVNELVATFDIYAFPSLWEGLPYALLEAMRARRAIIATDVGGVSEAIMNEETGLLVPAGSSEDLASAIARLIDEPALRERLAASARARYEAEFSLEAMHRQTESVFVETGLAGRQGEAESRSPAVPGGDSAGSDT